MLLVLLMAFGLQVLMRRVKSIMLHEKRPLSYAGRQTLSLIKIRIFSDNPAFPSLVKESPSKV